MIAERTCRSCGGNEFQVTAGHFLGGTAGELIERDHWFCSRCDWGADTRGRRDEGEILR